MAHDGSTATCTIVTQGAVGTITEVVTWNAGNGGSQTRVSDVITPQFVLSQFASLNRAFSTQGKATTVNGAPGIHNPIDPSIGLGNAAARAQVIPTFIPTGGGNATVKPATTTVIPTTVIPTIAIPTSVPNPGSGRNAFTGGPLVAPPR